MSDQARASLRDWLGITALEDATIDHRRRIRELEIGLTLTDADLKRAHATIADHEGRLQQLEATPVEPPVEPPEPDGTRYMALDGSDTNPGTLGAPWRSLHHAAKHLEPGSTLLVRGGHYDLVGTDVYWRTENILRFDGLPGAPITIRSHPGEHAVFDGINHPLWPRSFGDNTLAYEPRLWWVTGQHVHFRDLEWRNSVGGGPYAFLLDSKFIGCVFQANHAVGLALMGSRNEIAHNIFQDNYSVNNDGNSANGLLLRYSTQLTRADRHPDETASAHNYVHHNVARNNSDDGFGANTSKNGVWEYNVSFDNGYGSTGNGEGFKMGFDGNPDSGNIFRHNLSWSNRTGFNTNFSTGVTCHNNTTFAIRSLPFSFVVRSRPGSGDNTAFNNLSVHPLEGWHRAVESGVTRDTDNAGYPGRWDPAGGRGNFDGSNVSPRVLSFDWEHPDFLCLASDSPYAGAGVGAIPVGEEFAGGWDWRALARRFPSHGLKARSVMHPIPRG